MLYEPFTPWDVADGSPQKRARDRLEFLRTLHGAPQARIALAIKACERLSDEQLEAIKQARTPQDIKTDRNGGRITLILAAAASGKTTTMVALVEALCAYGHGTKPGEYTLYAMFNKNAADDGNWKLSTSLSGFAQSSVDCRTSHSAALKYNAELERNVRFPSRSHSRDRGEQFRCEEWTQQQIEAYVMKICGDEISNFLLGGEQTPADSEGQQRLRRDEELCAFWIYKTWLSWVQKAGAKEALHANNLDPHTRIHKLTYYPCVKNWTEQSDGKRRKRLPGCFPGTLYSSVGAHDDRSTLCRPRRLPEVRAA
jgi:hypothetical protein